MAMNRTFKVVIMIFSFIGLISCTQTTNISDQEPYKTAIGKHFILQKDMYVYQFNDPESSLRIGLVTDMSNPSIGIPNIIDKKYIGIKGAYITIKGVAEKGEICTIKNIIKKQTFENSTCKYYISLNNNIISSIQEIDTYDIVNISHNPPDTKTWSDPPIFKADAALPLPSDGIWWK